MVKLGPGQEGKTCTEILVFVCPAVVGQAVPGCQPRLPACPCRTTQLALPQSSCLGPHSSGTAPLEPQCYVSANCCSAVRDQRLFLKELSSQKPSATAHRIIFCFWKNAWKFLDLHINLPLWPTASYGKAMLILILPVWMLSMQMSPVLPLSNTK